MRVRARGLKDQRCAHTAGIGGNRGNDGAVVFPPRYDLHHTARQKLLQGQKRGFVYVPPALSLCHDNNLTRETAYKFQNTRNAILWYIYIPDRLKTSCTPSVRQESR